MISDPLSDIIRSLNLTGAVFLNAEFSAPWAITAHVTEDDCRPFMAAPKQLIAYHVVVDGDVVLSLDDAAGRRQHHRAKPGDLIFLPDNALHTLGSSIGLETASGDDLLLPKGEDGLVQIRHGGGGERTRILCGFMASGSGSTPLLESLPKILIINVESLATRRWIEASAVMAAREFSRGGMAGGVMVSGLCELLLIEALRIHIEQSPKPPGWLGGMAHPRIARALTRIHASLGDPPGIEDLATEVGMARSTFVDRFSMVMGVGPRRYILNQRMETAEMLLRDSQMNLADIASRVGYDASEAFSRAFKRERGLSPAEWRRLQSSGS